MSQQDCFLFKNYRYSPKTGKATFCYQITHKKEQFSFTETVLFPVSSELIPEALQKKLLDNLFLILGISYYKLFCPKKILLPTVSLTQKQAEFWNTVYTNGLGEFFYQNQIDFRGIVQFPYTEDSEELDSRLRGNDKENCGNDKYYRNEGFVSVSFPRKNRSLVGIGGGKDSIVTAELLKKAGKEFSCFVVNQHPIREQVISLICHSREPCLPAGRGGNPVPSLVITRTFDPQLFVLNKREDTYNGHIPVSAQYAFLGLFLAFLCDYRYVLVSNEESANYGNVAYLGMEINHQWSKSFAFEQLFQSYVREFITSDIQYFSLLRPMTELAITKEFVKYPKYFNHFSSCNKNFRIGGNKNVCSLQVCNDKKNLWCGECSKCAFTFAMLSAFLSKEELIGIFGQNLFAKASLLQTYKELLGVSKIKPFDCVGTPEEVAVAFSLALKRGEYADDLVMQFFAKEVLPEIKDSDALEKELFSFSKKHAIPDVFRVNPPFPFTQRGEFNVSPLSEKRGQG